MDLTITKQEKKLLVQREEIEATVTIEPTPSNKQIQEELTKKLNKPTELIIVKHIYSKFGSHENKIIAYIYDNKEALKKFEKIKEKKEEVKKEEIKKEEIKKEEKKENAKEDNQERKEEKKA